MSIWAKPPAGEPLSDAELEQLEQLVHTVPPGPWQAYDAGLNAAVLVGAVDYTVRVEAKDYPRQLELLKPRRQLAHYVAAIDPLQLGRLLQEVREARKRRR